MGKFEHVISLGFFCSPALELQRIGVRETSSPFDWLITPSFEIVLKLINNNFEDFLSKDLLYQIKDYPNYYRNIKYKIDFYHDFDELKTFDKQISYITEKYNRRIRRFYKAISQPTLFVRYINSSEDVEYIRDNYKKIQMCLKAFNSENEIYFVANSDCIIEPPNINIWYVDKDENDSVSRKFLEKNLSLENTILKSLSSSVNCIQ